MELAWKLVHCDPWRSIANTYISSIICSIKLHSGFSIPHLKWSSVTNALHSQSTCSAVSSSFWQNLQRVSSAQFHMLQCFLNRQFSVIRPTITLITLRLLCSRIPVSLGEGLFMNSFAGDSFHQSYDLTCTHDLVDVFVDAFANPQNDSGPVICIYTRL